MPDTLQQKISRALYIVSQKEKMKDLYKELEQLTLELKKFPKEIATVGLVVKDNFRKANVAWKQTAVSRFVLELATKPKKKKD